jgi:hypothetical protein
MNIKSSRHFTTLKAFQEILKSGKIKSRALLVSEALKQRPDWEVIRRDPDVIAKVLPGYMKDQYSFLRRQPIVWFSRQENWEGQAGEQTENKSGDWSDEANYSLPPKRLSQMETYRQGGGLIRLGLAEEKLLDWKSLLLTVYPPSYIVKAYLFDRLCLKGHNEQYVTGYVGEAVPLDQVDTVDMFLPDDESGDDGKGMWMPLSWPSDLPAKGFINLIQVISTQWSDMQNSRRTAPPGSAEGENVDVTTQKQ